MKKIKPGYYIDCTDDLAIVYPDGSLDMYGFAQYLKAPRPNNLDYSTMEYLGPLESETWHGIQCMQCDDEIYSTYRHDFKWCKCGAVAIDGGRGYTKICGNAGTFKHISKEVE